MSPVFHQESVLLTLPFGGAVLRALGMSQPETEAILEDFRKIHMKDVIPIADETFNFLDGYASNRKLPSDLGQIVASFAKTQPLRLMFQDEARFGRISDRIPEHDFLLSPA